MPNAIYEIYPYRTFYGWSFDDKNVGLKNEPFVAGIPEILDLYAGGVDKIALRFSAEPFPGANIKLDWLRPESGGNWYKLHGTEQEGWLCWALLKYFESAPTALYVEIIPAKEVRL